MGNIVEEHGANGFIAYILDYPYFTGMDPNERKEKGAALRQKTTAELRTIHEQLRRGEAPRL